jgi:hypothetical protein
MGGSAGATTLFDPDPTGVSTAVFLQAPGVATSDQDAGANLSSSSATESEVWGMASATFPNPNGTGGSVSAQSSISAASGQAGTVSAISSALFLGEFIADDGDASTTSFDLIVDLGVEGVLSVFDNNSLTGFNSNVLLTFSAVKENPADPTNPIILDSFFGSAILSRTDLGFPFGLIPPSGSSFGSLGFDPSGFSSSAGCADTDPVHSCIVTANTMESVSFNVNDGELFGISLFLFTSATIDNAFELELHSNFINTVSLSFPQIASGVTVTALPPTFPQGPGVVPEPATIWLLLASLVGVIGSGWRHPLRISSG